MLPTAIPNVMISLFHVFLVPTLVCGDFNGVFNRATDRRGVVPLGSGRESCDTLLYFFRMVVSLIFGVHYILAPLASLG